MRDTTRPTCGASPSAGRAALRCMHLQPGEQCGAAPGSCEHQREAPRQPAMSGMQPVSTSGYLQRVEPGATGVLNLEDDTPLSGGACNIGGDCESCQ